MDDIIKNPHGVKTPGELMDALANPAEAPTVRPPSTRTSLAVPQLKLSVSPIPGYVLHWFTGSPQRIQAALNAGYSFVNKGDVETNSTNVASDPLGDGNTDMGSRVSISAGQQIAEGQAERLYLMKIPKQLWNEDQAELEANHEQIAASLRGDKGFVEAGQDGSHRFGSAENRNIFQKLRRA